MTRRHVTFPCEGAILAGTIDEAQGTTGLLIVSGGNELRSGAFSGMAELAARIAMAGYPVFRFDRRGVGDSEGHNGGFRLSGPDIAAAIRCFLAEAPCMGRIVAFGNCDGATALALTEATGLHGLVLANPWTIEGEADMAPPPAAIRARYAEKLRNPRELLRLLRGQVSLRKLARGIGQALRPPPRPSTLAEDLKARLAAFSGPVRILLAGRDRTAQVFAAAWDMADPRIARCSDASHAFAEPDAREWLYDQLLAALADEQAGEFDMG